MDEQRLKAILEALLFAAGEPVSLHRLAAVIDTVPKEEIASAISALDAEYAMGGRGLTIEEVAGGYQLRTRKELAPQVRKLLETKPPRLSRSLLETLAIIAYRQPVTRPEIEELRGVDSGGVLETLLERRLIKIAGRKEAPGRPLIYATTHEFLEVFGLMDLDSLPDLKEFQEIERASREAESLGVEGITNVPENSTGDTEAQGVETATSTASETSVEAILEKSDDQSNTGVDSGKSEPHDSEE